MAREDYYKTLEIKKGASAEEIKLAYRKTAMKYHPDRNKDDDKSERKFKKCSEAYEVLSNPEKRKLYDQYGHAGLKNTGVRNYSHMNVNDIFSHFGDIFGGGFGFNEDFHRVNRPSRGRDIETTIEITLEDVSNGSKIETVYDKYTTCDKCKGLGCALGKEPSQCPDCNGVGQVVERRQQGTEIFMQFFSTCSTCRGQGSIILDPCDKCHGNKKILIKHNTKIKIPLGIHNGQIIRVSRQGEEGRYGGRNGDLYCHVSVKKHPIFERVNDDIILNLPVFFTDAIMGKNISVPTLRGEKTVRLFPGVEQKIILIEGFGLPNVETRKRGNQKVNVIVEVPINLTSKQNKLIRELSKEVTIDNFPNVKEFYRKVDKK